MSGYHSFSFTDSLFMDPTDGIKFGNHFEGLTYLFTPQIKNQFIVIGFLNQKLKFYYIGVKPTQTFLSLSFMVPINQDIKRIFENVNYLDQTELIIKYTQSDSNIKNDLMGALVRISHAHYLSSSIGVQLNQISVKRFISLPLFPPPRATINGHDLAMPYPIPPSLLSFNVKNEFNNSTHNNITQIYNIHCDDLNNALKITAPYVKGPICVFAASNYLSWVAFTCELDADFAEVYYQKAEKTDRWRLDEMDFMKERISFKRYFLTFVYQEFSTCLTDFCDDWKAFTFASNFYLEAHLIKLHLLSMKIKSFSLDCLTISYHQYYSLTVGWGYPDDLSVGEKKPKLRVLLHSEHPQNVRNPHLRIQFQLESLFNQTLSLTKLLHEIYLTLPVLSSLDEYEKRMLRGVNIIPKSCNAFRLIYSPSYSINVEIISQTKVRISDGSIFVDPKRAPPTPWNSKPVNISKKSTDDGKKAEEQKNQPPLRANSLNIHPEHIPYFKVFSSALPYLLEKSIANNPGFHPFNHNDNAVICSAHLIADILRALDWVFTLYSTFQSAYRTNPNQDPNKIPAFTAEEEYNYTYISNVGTWAIKAKEHLSTVECEALSLEPSDKSSRKLAHNLCDIFLGYLNRRVFN
ncbi:hypothetical protein K502DRAFT_78656 [Neoconidiobolus thromboides FSU 785]|nr:hypothetical protein K502DRAFT_78656 [Neoconidiobolus thromboides FSU 785]